MSRAPAGLPSTWAPDGPGGLSRKEAKGYSLVELSNYLTRVSTVDPPVVASSILAELVPDDERPTRPAPLQPIDLVRVPSLDGVGHEWIDALQLVEAQMPLRSISPEPALGPCVGCGRCTPRKTQMARKHARRPRG